MHIRTNPARFCCSYKPRGFFFTNFFCDNWCFLFVCPTQTQDCFVWFWSFLMLPPPPPICFVLFRFWGGAVGTGRRLQLFFSSVHRMSETRLIYTTLTTVGEAASGSYSSFITGNKDSAVWSKQMEWVLGPVPRVCCLQQVAPPTQAPSEGPACHSTCSFGRWFGSQCWWCVQHSYDHRKIMHAYLITPTHLLWLQTTNGPSQTHVNETETEKLGQKQKCLE